MITIKDFLKCVEYRVTGGSEYLWSSYGPNVRFMEHQSAKGHTTNTIQILFDTKTQLVYEMQAWDFDNKREYRWIHPEYIKSYKKEAKDRGLKWKRSIDERKFIDLEVAEDILEKSRAIFLGEEYDTRIIVPLELSKSEKYQLMELAHEADMSLNQYIENLLIREMKKCKAEA